MQNIARNCFRFRVHARRHLGRLNVAALSAKYKAGYAKLKGGVADFEAEAISVLTDGRATEAP